jgi:HAD superfamily hydrolase (TIGR01509 family)
VKAIVFDCDGVLVDSEELSWRGWGEVLDRHGIALTDDDVAALTGRTLDDCLLHFSDRGSLPDRDALVPELATVMHDLLERHLQAFEDAVDTLDVVAGRRRLAVASSSYRDRLDLSLRTTGLADRFEVSVAGDEVAHGKPAPDLFVEAANRLGVAPGDCVAVEDTPPGVRSAAAAGMVVVAVDRGWFEGEALIEAGADAVVPRLTPAALLR